MKPYCERVYEKTNQVLEGINLEFIRIHNVPKKELDTSPELQSELKHLRELCRMLGEIRWNLVTKK